MKRTDGIITKTTKIVYDSETGEVLSQSKKEVDGKLRYQFEWNDLRALITVVNVILVMLFGYSIAWFGLSVGVLGCIKDLTEIPDGKFRFSSLIMHLANVALNIFFLVQWSLN